MTKGKNQFYRFNLFLRDLELKQQEIIFEIKQLLQKQLGKNNFSLYVINVTCSPKKTRQANIKQTPTLIRTTPEPQKAIVLKNDLVQNILKLIDE